MESNNDKIKDIINNPKSQNHIDLERFLLGLILFYQKILVKSADISQPLNKIKNNRQCFEWNNDTEKSFEDLK